MVDDSLHRTPRRTAFLLGRVQGSMFSHLLGPAMLEAIDRAAGFASAVLWDGKQKVSGDRNLNVSVNAADFLLAPYCFEARLTTVGSHSGLQHCPCFLPFSDVAVNRNESLQMSPQPPQGQDDVISSAPVGEMQFATLRAINSK